MFGTLVSKSLILLQVLFSSTSNMYYFLYILNFNQSIKWRNLCF
jgi:hypothetical protein